VPAAPATNGAGFLFSDVSYRSYERVVPAEPTLPPAPSTPTPDTGLGAPASGAPEQAITVTGEGFDAYETVQLTWFSTPVFGGWVQADAWGRVSATVTVPASLPVGAHTLQAQGVRSGRVATTAFTVVLPHTGASAESTLALSLGGVLLLTGGAIVGARALRRRRAAA
jgi:primary-amine oxidase